MNDDFEGETVAAYNKRAWDKLARSGNQWTIPVSPEEIAQARQGIVSVVLTPKLPVPQSWLGNLKGKKVLGLASAGGQQCPRFAAAGAEVTVIDNSPEQLARDRLVAEREGLSITLIEGDMRDLSRLADNSFDLVFHPVSNGFVPNVRPVWNEAFRVLKPGGELLSGFANPVIYMLDLEKEREGIVQLKYTLPFSSTEQAHDPEIIKLREAGEPLDFGHTLDDQIGGQIDAGFHIVGFYEDGWGGERSPLYALMKGFLATRARKPAVRA